MTDNKILKTIAFYALVVVIVVFSVFPFYYAIVTSFATGTELFKVNYWPNSFSLANYESVLGGRNFGRSILNSLFIGAMSGSANADAAIDARVVGFTLALIGLVGAVMAVSPKLAPIAVWLVGMSPLSLPVYASSSLLSLAELPEGLSRAVPRAFQFWLFVAILTCCWLVKNLWVARRAMARKVLDAPAGDP